MLRASVAIAPITDRPTAVTAMGYLFFQRYTATRWGLLCALLIALILLSGCKSAPRRAAASPQPSTAAPFHAPAARNVVPAAYQAPAVPPILLLPPPSSAATTPELLPPAPTETSPAAFALTPEDAVALGLRENPRLRQMAAQSQVAWANADVAYAPFLPELGTSYRYSAFNTPVLPGGSFVPASLSSGVNSFSIAEAGVQYTIADFGRRAGHYGQAVHRSQGQDLAWDRARQTVAFEVVQAYFRLLAAQATSRVREQAMHDAERILADTKARREGGVVEREAVLRAEVELSLARQALLGASQATRDAEATLNVVMGQPPLVPLRVEEVLARPSFNLSVEECLEQAITERREIAMAREAVAEANHGVEAARGDLLPKVFVRGTTLRADSPGGVLNGFVEGIGIHVEQPLYSGGRHRGELRASEARVAAAVAGLQVIADNVSLQVSLAYQAINTERQRIQLAETAVAQARENLRLITVRYQNGNATPTDIVDAQTALVQTETSYYTAVYGYLEGLARLDFALGGDQQRLLALLRLPPSGMGPP
jgi:outer membrane protein